MLLRYSSFRVTDMLLSWILRSFFVGLETNHAAIAYKHQYWEHSRKIKERDLQSQSFLSHGHFDLFLIVLIYFCYHSLKSHFPNYSEPF